MGRKESNQTNKLCNIENVVPNYDPMFTFIIVNHYLNEALWSNLTWVLLDRMVILCTWTIKGPSIQDWPLQDLWLIIPDIPFT